MLAHKGKELPTLPESQYSLVHVDPRTGKVLDTKGEKPCDVTKDDWALIFDSLEEAEAYALEMISRLPDLQCSIYDHQKEWVKDVTNKGHMRDFRRPAKLSS